MEKTKECKIVNVPSETCTLRFCTDNKVKTQVESESFVTSRGELMILILDKHRKVLEIELLGKKKPCQEHAET